MAANSLPQAGRTLLIAGEWRAASDGETLPLINPATGAELTRIAQASARDIGEACRAAADAFPQWAAHSGRERAAILQRAAAIYRERYLDESARLLTMENGKPLNDSLKECRYSADVLDFYAAEARRLTGTHFSGDQGRARRIASSSNNPSAWSLPSSPGISLSISWPGKLALVWRPVAASSSNLPKKRR